MKKKLWLVPTLIAGLIIVLNYFPTKKPVDNIAMAYAKLPLSFIENQGQVDEKAKFYLKGSDHSIFFTDNEIAYAFADSLIHQKFVGANKKTMIQGSKQAQGKINYLVGQDQKNWKTNIPTYEEVIYQDLYPGIDLVLKGESQGKLKSEFRVAAGADYKKILIAYDGADDLKVSDAGDLVIQNAKGELQEKRPFIYQIVDGKRVEVSGNYHLLKNQYGFELASYNPNYTLIIDPELIYSTYLGGSSDERGSGIAVDSSGDAYITGYTESTNFPTESPFQATKGNSFDAFVTKFSPNGSSLIYSTFLGGSSLDRGHAIAVDSSGSAYVTGETLSTNFPTTASAFQATKNIINYSIIDDDVFVTKLSADGSNLVYSTYLGGSGYDEGRGIAVDSSGSAYVTGWTNSQNFPTAAAFQLNRMGSYDAFVTKLSPNGSSLIYSTYLGGGDSDEGRAITVDSSDSAYVAGRTRSAQFPIAAAFQATKGSSNVGYDAFVTKLSANGSSLVYSTFLGGGNTDESNGIAVDSSGNAYITGYTESTNFPTESPFQAINGGGGDVFVTKLGPDGSNLIYSTYLGGDSLDAGYGIAVDSSGNAYVTGRAFTNFPTTSAFQEALSVGDHVFVTKLSPDGSNLIYSTYLGGDTVEEAYDIDVDSIGNAYVTGRTLSQNFPTASPFQATNGGSWDAFVAKIGEPAPPPPPPPPPSADLAVDFSSLAGQRIVPNQTITITLTVKNYGPDAATNVKLEDTITRSLSMLKSPPTITVSTNQGSCQLALSESPVALPVTKFPALKFPLTCELGTIRAPGNVKVKLKMTAKARGWIKHSATVSASTPDDNMANNSSELTVTVQ